MCAALLQNYPALKRQAMILALLTNCKDVIKAKVSILRSQTWMAAAMSTTVALAPVPGLSIGFDCILIARNINFYKKQLGLDDESLDRIAITHYISLNTLKNQLQTILPTHFFTGTLDLTVSLFKNQAVGTVAEEVLRFLPLLGPVISSSISFGMIFYVLRNLLNSMEKAALALIDIITERCISDDDSP